MSIFCPSHHLMLTAERCPVCSWTRPPAAAAGTPLWGPAQAGPNIGGPGRDTYARPGIAAGVVVIAVRPEGSETMSELAGLCLADGRVLWRKTLEAGISIPGLIPDPREPETPTRLLAAQRDQRTYLDAGGGALLWLEPTSGETSLYWQSDEAELTLPVAADNLLIVRGSKSLIALQGQERLKIKWQNPLVSWRAEAPALTDGLAIISDGSVMHDAMYMQAFDLVSGVERWRFPLPGRPLALETGGSMLLLRVDDRARRQARLLAYALKEPHKIAWEINCKRFYAAPLVARDISYLVMRGNPAETEPDYYTLLAVETQSGKTVWRTPLEGRRVRKMILHPGNILLSSSDDGRICAWDSLSGGLLWEQVVGGEDNPPQTELVFNQDLLVIGGYFGQVTALQIQAQSSRPDACPDDSPEAEAEALALEGDLVAAATIYQQLGQPERAIALYERAGAWQPAGELAQNIQRLDLARKFYELAGDDLKLAQVLEALQDWLGAAELYARAGSYQAAAINYERGKELRLALENYRQCNDLPAIHRLEAQVPLTLDDIEIMIKRGEQQEAAEKLMLMGEFRRAIDLLEDLPQPQFRQMEMEALQAFNQRSPEPWALERQASAARRDGKFALEAETLCSLAREEEAAEAWLRAARQADKGSPNSQAAQFYEKAAQKFEEAGQDEKARDCRRRVLFHRGWPLVTVTGGSEKPLKEDEYCQFILTVSNVGFGTARNVSVTPGLGGYFELAKETTVVLIRALPAGHSKPAILYLRPKEKMVGEVPLELVWTWQNPDNTMVEEKILQNVIVRRKDDRRQGGTPVIIQAQTYVQGEYTHIDGDQLQGNAQKGDRVEVNRGSEPGIQLRSSTRRCPNCDSPMEADDLFCNACGHTENRPQDEPGIR